jgi:hypothetical protein
MARDVYKCIKCGHSTSRGFGADYSDGANSVAKWIEGEPAQMSFLSVKGINVETGGRRQFSIRTLRCERCGFLELYAV